MRKQNIDGAISRHKHSLMKNNGAEPLATNASFVISKFISFACIIETLS